MEPIAHALWTYLLYKETGAALLAIVAGIFPDIVALFPRLVYNFAIGKRTIAELDTDETLPHGLKRYVHYAFHATHSLVVASAVWIGAALIWGPQWWLLAWHFHIGIDIFMHRDEKATPFLWPLFDFRFHGIMWDTRKALIGTYLALGVVYGLLWAF